METDDSLYNLLAYIWQGRRGDVFFEHDEDGFLAVLQDRATHWGISIDDAMALLRDFDNGDYDDCVATEFAAINDTSPLFKLGQAKPNVTGNVVRSKGETISPLRPSTLAELQHWDIPAHDDLLEGILPCDGVGIVSGPPKVGKTFWLLDLALNVARDAGSFLDVKLGHGPVLYLALELSLRELKDRVSTLLINTDLWPEHFHFRVRGGIQNAAGGGLDLLRNLCLEIRPALVVIDTYGAFRIAPNGQSLYDADYSSIDSLRGLGVECHCLILVAHHTGKRSRGGDPGMNLIATHGLAAGACVMLELTRRQASSRGKLTVSGNSVPYQQIPLAWNDKLRRWTLGERNLGRPNSTLKAAMEFLTTELCKGPRPASAIMDLAASDGICSPRTLKTAKANLGIKSTKQGDESYWTFPNERIPRVQ